MPRPILGKMGTSTSSAPLVPAGSLRAGRSSSPSLELRLRQSRSRSYREALAHLDAGEHHADPLAAQRLAEAVAAEFADLALEERPLGLVAVCHLGTPFEVHICDFSGMIIEHYPVGRSMPAAFERARSIALHPAYLFIEVYSQTLRAVSHDGSVAVLER